MLKTVPAPTGARLGDRYKAFVREVGQTTWQELSVYLALCPDGTTNYHEMPPQVAAEFNGFSHCSMAKQTFFASFTANVPVEVRVVFNGTVQSARLKPLHLNLVPQVQGNTLYFAAKPGQKLSLELNGDLFGELTIFANQPAECEPPFANQIYFKPGYYTHQNCEYITLDEHGTPVLQGVRDNTLIYLEDGAVVNAAVVLSGNQNVKIAGCGVFSLIERCYGAEFNFTDKPLYAGFRYWALPMVYIKSGCKNITVQGVSLVGEFRRGTVRNSAHIHLNGVKCFTAAVNGDGLNCVNTCHVLMENCYFRNGDDNVCMYTGYDSIPTLNDLGYPPAPPVSENYEVRNCVFWTNCRPFQIAGHGTGSTSPHNRVANINIHHNTVNDVAFKIFGNSEQHNAYWSGILRSLSQSEVEVFNIRFEHIHINWTPGYTGKPIHLEVRDAASASYSEGRGFAIHDVLFKDIYFENCPEHTMPSYLLVQNKEALPQGYGIFNVKFQGVYLNQKPLTANNLLCQGGVEYKILETGGEPPKFLG